MIVLESLLPVILLIIGGVLLKKYKLTNDNFLQTSDTLVYYIFFPVMLFWKIGNSSYETGINWDMCLAVLLALCIMFLVSFILITALNISDFQAGAFAQSCYRFNTYIGVAIVLNGIGEEGIRLFGILIAIAIPLINVVAVTTLIWYSQEKKSFNTRLRLIFKALVSNPLIIGCVAGLLYSQSIGGYPTFIDNTLGLISMLTLPLALLSVGGSLSFAGVKNNIALSFCAAAAKLLLFPLLGYVSLLLFNITGTPFTVAMIFCSLPTSTAIYILSSKMNSDPELASSAIVVSTLLSFPVLTLVLLL